MALVYKVVYTPNKDTKQNVLDSSVNFLCSDDKLHIRLRDYDHEEVISGFVNKLTYVITYLIQNYVAGNKSDEEVIDSFVKNDAAFCEISLWLNEEFTSRGVNYKGIKLSKSYRKVKKNSKSLGSFKEGTCYLEGGCKFASFENFALSLGIVNLGTFLLNDAIDLVIVKDTSKKSCYTKFTNKQVKKVKKNKLEYIPLF